MGKLCQLSVLFKSASWISQIEQVSLCWLHQLDKANTFGKECQLNMFVSRRQVTKVNCRCIMQALRAICGGSPSSGNLRIARDRHIGQWVSGVLVW